MFTKQYSRLSDTLEFLFIVTENQSQSAVTPPQVANKPSSTPFGISAQPFSRLGWNPNVKAKQEEVRKIECMHFS